mgnify:CR=1 FL=1
MESEDEDFYDDVSASKVLAGMKKMLPAKAQGQCEDPAKMKYILAQYMLRCPKELSLIHI